jgi:tetratricopeptide (TPR) repeat protein
MIGWSWVLALGAATTVAAVDLRGAPAAAAPATAPRDVNAEPWSPKAADLTTRSVGAELSGDSQTAVALADQAIRANPRDPWPYYDKGMALARLGQTDAAVASLTAAEEHFARDDRWGIGITKFGRGHVLAQAGRCAEARDAFEQYASFVEQDDQPSANMARRYAAQCTPKPVRTTTAPTPKG